MQKKLLMFLMFLGAIGSAGAQEIVTAAGGEADGSGGHCSYTVGQVAYVTNTGYGGINEAQGVQQPYEISIVKETPGSACVKIVLYPNPSADHVTVDIQDYDADNMEFVLYDITGKFIQRTKATGVKTVIKIAPLATAYYLLKVLNNQKEIKVFKIAKIN